MEKIGILIETTDGEIKSANSGVVTAARGHDHELYAFLFDSSGVDAKAWLERYGIHKIVEVRGEKGPLEWNPVTWTNAVIQALDHFGINILLGLTSPQGKDLLPRIAARLDAPLVMDCIQLNLSEHTAIKSQYSGKTVATIRVNGPREIYGIRPNAVDAQLAPCEAEAITFQAEVDNEDLIVKGIERANTGGIDLSEAEIIISGGRGMENPENFTILFDCAKVIGAAVGASRAAVDAGWVPYSMQVGQTGETVGPKVYIACGISGSVQHFAGMKTSGLIVAINTDPQAPIMAKCDYYVVGNVLEYVPELTKVLREFLDHHEA